MTPTLQGALRQHLIDRARALHTAYDALCAAGERTDAGGAYTPAALDLFPRARLVDAALIEVEALGLDAAGLEEARGALDAALSRSGGAGPVVGAPAREDERARLRAWLTAATPGPGAAPPPRRTLSPTDEAAARARLHSALGEVCWPLSHARPTVAHRLFDAAMWSSRVHPDDLRAALAATGQTGVHQLPEDGPARVADLAWLEPVGDRAGDTLWADPDARWSLFLSHEDTVTAVGAPLLAILDVLWPDNASFQIAGAGAAPR